MKRLTLAVASLVMLLGVNAGHATIVDFEGFAALTPLGAVVASDGNVVTFSVAGNSPDGLAYVADVGNPMSAFVPADTPAAAVAGTRFLTDEPAGPNLINDYFMSFAKAVTDLSLDLFDFRADGGARVGDVATLTVFSDAGFTTAVGSDTFTVVAGLVDGNVENLSVAAPSANILSASLVFSGNGDVGTGIDNVTFTTVPEPSSLLVWSLIGLSFAGVGRWRRRKSA